jgi:hypothetical protein
MNASKQNSFWLCDGAVESGLLMAGEKEVRQKRDGSGIQAGHQREFSGKSRC